MSTERDLLGGGDYVAPADPCPFVFNVNERACIQCEKARGHVGRHWSVLHVSPADEWYDPGADEHGNHPFVETGQAGLGAEP